MPTYAQHTTVSEHRSREEIERILTRYGATAFAYGWAADAGAAITFRLAARQVRIELPLPRRDDPAFTEYQQGSKTFPRSQAEATRRYEQAVRQRWRALKLVIQAKLEACEAGISTVEAEFLAQTLLPDGRTVGAWARPQLDQVYLSGQMPPLLLALPSGPGATP
jgi:hypothetical protein